MNSEGAVVYAFDILGKFKIDGGKIMEWSDDMDTSQFKTAWAAQDPGNSLLAQ